jgi:uncharacterized protein
MMFTQVQQGFMDYIRDPNQPLPTGIEPRRMKIYRDLFFNNLDGFVSSAFPVLKSLYASDDWQMLVQAFFVNHDCQSPIFMDIAAEFLQFLQTEYQTKESDPVFMLELAHYEWLELVVAVAQEDELQMTLRQDEVKTATLCLSASARVAQYHFDVQHISVDYQPEEPTKEGQFFCVYRDDADEVAFLQLSPLSAQVLAYLEQAQQCTLSELCHWLQGMYPQMLAEQLNQGAFGLLAQLADKGIVKTRA